MKSGAEDGSRESQWNFEEEKKRGEKRGEGVSGLKIGD